MARARLIYNPTAGREEIRRNLADILDKLEMSGWETSCHATKGEGDAAKAARKAAENGFDLVIAAGGDGTVNEVVNGIAGLPNRPRLGIIPAGTTNDFARAVGIPRRMDQACQVLAAGYNVPVDIGKLNDRYFINIAGGGWMTDVTYDVPSKLKTVIGQLAYYAKGLEKLPSIRPIRIKMEAADRVIEETVMLFLIANSNSVGGFEKLAPTADLSDGLFDVIVVKQTNLAEFIRLAGAALRGDHINDSHIIYFKTNRLSIRSPDRVLLNLDGEMGGELPCEFEVLQHHLEVIVPKNHRSKGGFSMADVQVGQPVPDFKLPASDGKEVALSDFRGKKVVLYFYPKDMTPGCTTEACDFRDAFSEFAQYNAVVLGVSPDNLQSHEKFIAKHNLPFLLLSDEDHEVAERFGVWKQKKNFGREYMGIERSTFVIDEEGKLVKEWRNVRVKGHVEEVLDFVKSM